MSNVFETPIKVATFARIFTLFFLLTGFSAATVLAQCDPWECDTVPAGGYQSVARAQVAPTTAAFNDVLPASARLTDNYPNPFNPQTTIRFALTEAQPVRLSVYNMLGQQVAMLVEGTLEAGRHEARFDAGALPSGLYLARLSTPTGVQVRSMLLLK